MAGSFLPYHEPSSKSGMPVCAYSELTMVRSRPDFNCNLIFLLPVSGGMGLCKGHPSRNHRADCSGYHIWVTFSKYPRRAVAGHVSRVGLCRVDFNHL